MTVINQRITRLLERDTHICRTHTERQKDYKYIAYNTHGAFEEFGTNKTLHSISCVDR